MGGSESRSAHRLTIAELLKQNAGRFVQQHPKQAVPQVQSTLAKISLCRTSALGGRAYRCGGCDHRVIVANSCGDRYCPTCSGARRSDWLESTRELIIDGVDHFQVVFTLPDRLSRLALGNRTVIYNLLFQSAWSALKATILSEHGYDAAALMVLHTWNQKLDAHAHLHAVVPSCGPSLDDGQMRWAQRGEDESTRGRYLVDAEELRCNFRNEFLKGLNILHARNALKLTGEFATLKKASCWNALNTELKQTSWVSFIQPPPRPGQTAQHVLKYLARYLSGGPISNSRIVSTDDNSVTFMARAGKQTGGDTKQVPIRISQVEFVRRWCLHVLPSGYTRTRRFGGWSNTRRRNYIEAMTRQLNADTEESSKTHASDALEDVPEPNDASPNDEVSASKPCPNCGSSLIPHTVQNKPSWSEVMASTHRPLWYQRL